MLGIPLLGNEKVSWFLVFWSLGFVSLSIGFKVSKIYQISISCFLEDTDPISKIPGIVLDGSSGLFGARLFPNRQTHGFLKL